jgi:hypothetical protein
VSGAIFLPPGVKGATGRQRWLNVIVNLRGADPAAVDAGLP